MEMKSKKIIYLSKVPQQGTWIFKPELWYCKSCAFSIKRIAYANKVEGLIIRPYVLNTA